MGACYCLPHMPVCGFHSKIEFDFEAHVQVSLHLSELAAEWDIPSASTYLQTINKATTTEELCAALDQVLIAEGQAQQNATGGDAALLLAAAVGYVVLTDMKCSVLLPKIVDLNKEVHYWQVSAEPQWRLALQPLSLPLGPTLAARFPSRALEHRLHESKVAERAVARLAADATEDLGRLHTALASLAAAHDMEVLLAAVHDNLVLLSSGSSGSAGAAASSGMNGRFQSPATPHVLLRNLRRVAGGAGGDGDDSKYSLPIMSYSRPAARLWRRWPEAAIFGVMLVANRAHISRVAAKPGALLDSAVAAWQSAVGGLRNVFIDHLQEPIGRIAEAVLAKPKVKAAESSLMESQEILDKMIRSFNTDVKQGVGMPGVMNVWEHEIRCAPMGFFHPSINYALLQITPF